VEPARGGDAVAGRVVERRFAGSVTMYRVRTESGAELLVSATAGGAAVGDAVGVALAAGARAHAFPATAVIPSEAWDPESPAAGPEDLAAPRGHSSDPLGHSSDPLRHSRESGNRGTGDQAPGFPPARE
jgi:hypothetical protein